MEADEGIGAFALECLTWALETELGSSAAAVRAL